MVFFIFDVGLVKQAYVCGSEKRDSKSVHKLTPLLSGDCGDHVVIINAKHIAFSGNKWEQKVYSSHTG